MTLTVNQRVLGSSPRGGAFKALQQCEAFLFFSSAGTLQSGRPKQVKNSNDQISFIYNCTIF